MIYIYNVTDKRHMIYIYNVTDKRHMIYIYRQKTYDIHI